MTLEPQPGLSTTKKPSKKLILLGGLIAVLLIAAFCALYYWQHQKVTAANSSISSLNAQVGDLKNQVTSLRSKVNSLNSKLSSSSAPAPKPKSQTDLSINVIGAARFNIMGAINTPDNGIGIEVTVTNSSGNSIYLDPGQITLQDIDNHTYSVDTEVAETYIPTGYVTLAGQSIAAGQSVKGALFYKVDDLGLTSFKLLNGSSSYPVTVK